MKNIYVIGGGTKGLDIARVFASKNFNVTVYDLTEEIITRSEARLKASLNKRVARGKMTQEEMDGILANMAFTTNFDNIGSAEFIIEAIIENTKIKKELYANLDAVCSENTIFATNTSALSITELASATKRPDKFIGMHFFNPATVMKLVEVIRGQKTSDETFETVRQLSLDIGKQPVEVNEAPGFVVNRILIPLVNEGCCIVQEGVASVKDVDTAMKLGANHPMGPLELGDLIGLDVCLAVMDTMYNETHDPKYRACTLLRKMVRAGQLGRKTGKGFYEY